MSPILIVEDHPLVAEATEKLLIGLGDNIEPVLCATADQARAQLDERDWFRVFLDLDVPGAYGLSLVRDVEDSGLAQVCCVVSAFDRREYIDEVRDRGLLGYIVKATPVEQFRRAICAVLEGTPTFPDKRPSPREPTIRLTRRQTGILDLIRQGRSSKEVSDEIHIAEGTVNNHVAAVLQALGASSRAQAVARAIELGILPSRELARQSNSPPRDSPIDD